MSEKVMITLEDGSKADVGRDEFELLLTAIQSENPRYITLATVDCFKSSEILMDKLFKDLKKAMKDFSIDIKHKEK